MMIMWAFIYFQACTIVVSDFGQNNNSVQRVNTYQRKGPQVKRPDPKIPVFLHFPKTGGKSITRVIEQCSAQLGLQIITTDWSLTNATAANIFFKEIMDASKKTDKIMILPRHTYFKVGFLEQYLKNCCTYFTILREPLERSVSGYFDTWDANCRGRTNHPERKYSLEGCKEWPVSMSDWAKKSILGLKEMK